MANTQTLIAQAYSAFNHRDIDSALALMSEHVSWPKASEGGRVVGKEEIRSYWVRQWKAFDPHVEPLERQPAQRHQHIGWRPQLGGRDDPARQPPRSELDLADDRDAGAPGRLHGGLVPAQMRGLYLPPGRALSASARRRTRWAS